MKKIFILIFSVFVCVLSCGQYFFKNQSFADGNIKNEYTIITKYDGSIEEENIFVINTLELGTEKANVIYKIETKLENFKNNFKNNFYAKVENSNLSLEKQSQYKNGYDCTFKLENPEIDTIYCYFNIKYASNEIYNFAWGLENSSNDNSNLEYKYNFLTYNIIQKTRVKTGTLIKLNNDEYTSLNIYLWWFVYDILRTNQGESFANNFTKPNYTYNYITTSKRLHSSADRVFNMSGYYVHYFNVDFNNPNKEIYFYQTEARRAIWYAIILGISLLSVVGCFVYLHFKDKNKKNEENIEKTL